MGYSGHRGFFATLEKLENSVFWTGMEEDIRSFVKTCESTLGRGIIPRPLGEALHAESPNEVFHFDFLYLGRGEDQFTYVLVIKDDFSSFYELFPCRSADSFVVADALIDWFKRFGTPKVFVSDQGSHFKNRLLSSIADVIGASHHFSLAYVP
jgi:transposase InsO family protein